MLANLTAQDYVATGQAIAALGCARNVRADDYRAKTVLFLQQLDKCGFAAAKATVESLTSATMREAGGVITPAAANELEAMVIAVRLALDLKQAITS